MCKIDDYKETPPLSQFRFNLCCSHTHTQKGHKHTVYFLGDLKIYIMNDHNIFTLTIHNV